MSEKKILRPRVDDEFGRQVANVINKLVGNIPDDSTAATVADLREDFNDLLAVLRGLDAR